jgi:hypothetical protein
VLGEVGEVVDMHLRIAVQGVVVRLGVVIHYVALPRRLWVTGRKLKRGGELGSAPVASRECRG